MGTVLVEPYFFHLVTLLVLVVFAFQALSVLDSWPSKRGYEPEWVAESIAAGHGYSLDGEHHWLFEPSGPDDYFPTAWTAPTFTFAYAELIRFLGGYSRLAILLLCTACFAATGCLVAAIGRELGGVWAGLIGLCVFLSMDSTRRTAMAIGSEALEGLLVAGFILLFLRRANRLTARSAIGLGAALGATILTAPATTLFLPVSVLLIFVTVRRPPIRLAWLSAVIVVTAIAVVSPWTVRNYLVFNALVPVRTGLGQLAYIGTVGMAQTFAPERTKVTVPVPWVASGPREAVYRVMGYSPRQNLYALHRWQLAAMESRNIPGFETMNEAQRDALYFDDARDFVLRNPVTTAWLAAAKLIEFIKLPGRIVGLLLALGFVACFFLAFRRRMLFVPTLLAAAYCTPFTIIVPYYYRYRYPAEPLFAALSAVALVHGLRFIGTRRHWLPASG